MTRISDPKLTRTVTRFALVIAVLVAISLPAIYFAVSYRLQRAVLKTEAEINGWLATEVINASPTMWRFLQPKLNRFVTRRPSDQSLEVRRIVDTEGKIITESADALSAPTLWSSGDLWDGGTKVARIEIGRSLRPVLYETAGVAVFGLLLGGWTFAALRVLPVRALNRALAENTKLVEVLEHRVAEITTAQSQLTSLYEINLATTSTIDLQGTLRILMEKIEVIFPRSAVQVWLINPESGALERAACKNLDEAEWKGRKLSGIPCLVEEALKKKTPVIAPNVQTDARTLDPEYYRRQGVISYLGIPLVVKDKAVGDLVLLTRDEHQFFDDEIHFLSTLGGQAAITIQNAQLFKEAKRAEDVQKFLKELSQDIASSDIESLLKKFTEKVREFFKVDVTDVRIIEKGVWKVRGVSGIEPENVQSDSTGTSRGRSRWVIQNRKPLLVPDLLKQTEFSGGESIRKVGIRGYVGVPLFSRGGEVIGILRVLTYEPREFSQSEVDLLQQLANGAAIALANARLYEDLALQANDLRRSNAELEQFAYVASHDLQEPLRMITGYTNLLAKRYKGKLDQDADDYIGYAADGAKRMHGLINDLLRYSRVGTKGKEFALTDCEAVLAETLVGLQIAIQESGATITHDPLPNVMGDESQLGQLFQNLIANGIRYRDSKAPEIHVSCKPEGEEWLFSVKDNGIGIDPKYAERIFVIFQRLHTREEYSGTGIGLAVCKKIVERHGGKIWVESEPGKGATFHFTLTK
jgi:signal transduction histidine kinase